MKKNLLLILALLPFCLFSQIIKIGTNVYTTLDDACGAASNGDVITITGKYVHQSVFGISKNVTIKGITPDAQITFGTGDARLGFASTSTVTVQNLTIVGVPRSQRQMFAIDASHVIFKNDTIRDCYNTGPTDEHGGAFLLAGTATLEARNCVFTNNKCSKNAGVFWSIENSNIKLYDCLFTKNIAQYQSTDGKGGVFACVGGPHTIFAQNCAFIGNSSEGNAGAYWLEGQNDAKFVNCTFSKNTAGIHGGAISFWDKGSCDLINCNLYDNSVKYIGGGGAIFFNFINNTVNLQNTVLTTNGYDDGLGASGPSNIEGDQTVPSSYSITANNSYYTSTDANVSVSGSNNLTTGAIYLNAVDLTKGLYWNAIAVNSSVLIGNGNPSYLQPYCSTDQRGFDRNMSSKICIGAFEYNGKVKDSVIIKKQISDQNINNTTSEIRVSYDDVMEVYLIPPSDLINGTVDYTVQSSNTNVVTAILDKTKKEIVITRKTQSAGTSTITLTGYSPINAYSSVTFNVNVSASNSIIGIGT